MTEATATAAKCRGVRADGRPCEAAILVSDHWCFAHHPDLATQRAEARERGGANSSNVSRLRRHLRPSALGPVFNRLEAALAQVHDGDLAPARAAAMATVARALIGVWEITELEQRIEQLEQSLTA